MRKETMKCNHVSHLGKYPVTCRLCRKESMKNSVKYKIIKLDTYRTLAPCNYCMRQADYLVKDKTETSTIDIVCNLHYQNIREFLVLRNI